MKASWDWFLETLKQEESFLPKRCINRLIHLCRDSCNNLTNNWAAKIKDFLTLTEHEFLWDILEYAMLAAKTPDIFNKYSDILRAEDVKRWAHSYQLIPSLTLTDTVWNASY